MKQYRLTEDHYRLLAHVKYGGFGPFADRDWKALTRDAQRWGLVAGIRCLSAAGEAALLDLRLAIQSKHHQERTAFEAEFFSVWWDYSQAKKLSDILDQARAAQLRAAGKLH